jgi:hypothetical protein
MFLRTHVLLATAFLEFLVEWGIVRPELLTGLVTNTRTVNCYMEFEVTKFIAPCYHAADPS